MAIPSVFTAMDYDGHRLVDGGLVRNFPVRDVKEMGADIVIGSNVTSGLLSSDKIRNVFQIPICVCLHTPPNVHARRARAPMNLAGHCANCARPRGAWC